MNPLFAFYDDRGTGFLEYQDERGHPVARGEKALRRWREMGQPHVVDYPHAISLGLVDEGRKTIITDAQGRPLDKPKRADFTSDIAFIHATHAFNDKVTGIGNRAFDEGLHAAMARPALPPGTSAAEVELFDTVRSGDKVTIVNRFGQISTGRAVMRGPAGWVLNMGGRHGTPAIATPDNITAVRTPKSKR